MSELFKIKGNKYNLHRENTLVVSNVHTARYGLDSISYLGPKIWDLVPDEIKKCSTLIGFKQKIKMWVPAKCPCTLCKTYIPNLGYVPMIS